MYYSQCQEDQFLNTYIFKNKRNGIYIELGALDGVLYSNTKFFEDSLGWSGILIEPHPEKFNALKNNRPNNHLFENLVSCYTEPQKFRYFVDIHAAVSGIENTLPQSHFKEWFESTDQFVRGLPQKTITMIPKTLTEIIKSTELQHFDLLSLDVEGHEYEVLQSWDFSSTIDVILLETLGTQPTKDKLCKDLLEEKGYIFMQKYRHNEIFVLPHIYTKLISDN